jgi:hypothetical protein
VGQVIERPPQGASYRGFVFAHSQLPHAAEYTLRRVHGRLTFGIDTPITVEPASA